MKVYRRGPQLDAHHFVNNPEGRLAFQDFLKQFNDTIIFLTPYADARLLAYVMTLVDGVASTPLRIHTGDYLIVGPDNSIEVLHNTEFAEAYTGA